MVLDYQLLDTGHSEKLEQFGPVTLIRPAAQALWRPQLPQEIWQQAAGRFVRTGQTGSWQLQKQVPQRWEMHLEGIRLLLKRTEFGHLGVFPEHASLWPWMLSFPLAGARILNLFAYSGATSLALTQQGAFVTHLDAAAGMVEWARENARLNGLEKRIRWIVEDVRKYLARAQRRGERYEAIVVDPPSFGRGAKQEVFKIEYMLPELLTQCAALLAEKPLFLAMTCHTPGLTPLVLHQLLQQRLEKNIQKIESGELVLKGAQQTLNLPSGTFVKVTLC